jgi:tetratricopeptide (TPR) repeat protein
MLLGAREVVMRWIPSAMILGCLVGIAAGDVVRLNDGSTLVGDVKKSSEGWIVTAGDGKTTLVRPEQMKSIQMTPSTAPAAMMARLISLRRALDNVSDISTIIDRYQNFIDHTTDKPTLLAAEQDLAVWKDRQAKGLIKFGNQWVPAADRAKLQQQALGLASQAREYIKQGRFKEADPILQKALAIDPACASATYLRGIMLYRQDHLADARKAFEATLAATPDHVPTLNNLAIVLYQQKQVPAALNQYDRAMIVSPQDQWVLTNVAEALQSLPGDLHRNDIVRKVQKRFDEQIVPLESKLASKGLYRWGATWVTAADLDKLKAAEAANKSKLDALSVDFDAAQADLTRITQSIADNQATLRRIEAESVRYDASGQLVRLAYPPVYYEIVRDNQKLTADRAGDITKMEQIRTQAKAIQQQLPTPRYTGVQRMIGVEGTPIAPMLPTTSPSTQP